MPTKPTNGRSASRLADGPRTARATRSSEAIRKAAADLFFEHGYEATSLRQVAAKVGIQVGSLYNHISGKEELLTWIMIDIMDDLTAALEAAVADETDAVDRLRAAIDTHIRFHASRARDVFIGNSELRALSAANRRKVVSKRDAYEHRLRELVEAAASEGRADVIDSRLQTYAILAIGAHVSGWYRPRGPLSLNDIVESYTRMMLRQLGIFDPVG